MASSLRKLGRSAILVRAPWRWPGGIEQALEADSERMALWLPVLFAAGIGAWWALPSPRDWLALLAALAGIAMLAALPAMASWPRLRMAMLACAALVAAGMATIWAKAELAGEPPLARPVVATLDATIAAREELPARAMVRLVLQPLAWSAPEAPPRRIRLNLTPAQDRAGLVPGAAIRVRARMVPPAPAIAPGGYDFARAAFFKGLAATGSALSVPAILRTAPGGGDERLDSLRRAVSQHVRSAIVSGGGDAAGAGIAAALVVGDRGAVPDADEDAMRASGLAHLLSVSGLHVTAVTGFAWMMAMRLLALVPWLALRLVLPLVAAAAGALAAIAYTMLTGAEVPTVRSCIAALLVLAALALGRSPLSPRLVAAGALLILCFWPESLLGPSFQMSFAAVATIVVLHEQPLMALVVGQADSGWRRRLAGGLASLFVTGLAIEAVLTPIALAHFHVAGLYGAAANLLAIPLTTFVVMPLLALALLLDLAGIGAPAWWLAATALGWLTDLAHATAAMPGARWRSPAIPVSLTIAIVAGLLWWAIWRGWWRWPGLAVAVAAMALLPLRSPPDLLVARDGRQALLVADDGEHLLLRAAASGFAAEQIAELAGSALPLRGISDHPAARCTRDFCAIDLDRGGRRWSVLVATGRDYVPERALAAACERTDIVIAQRRLPGSCRPRWLKADRAMLERHGGMAVHLGRARIETGAQAGGQHGWEPPPLPPLRLPTAGIAAGPASRSDQ